MIHLHLWFNFISIFLSMFIYIYLYIDIFIETLSLNSMWFIFDWFLTLYFLFFFKEFLGIWELWFIWKFPLFSHCLYHQIYKVCLLNILRSILLSELPLFEWNNYSTGICSQSPYTYMRLKILWMLYVGHR